MKSSLIWCLVMVGLVVGVGIGCRSMFADSDDDDSAVSAAQATDPSDASNVADPGFFTETGHNVESNGLPQFINNDEDGEETQSHFRAIQLDPSFEDTAGPKFLIPADMNGDGLLDIVSGHTQSQPVQVHLQRREDGRVRFDTINIGGTSPIGTIAGIAVADIDVDGSLDVVVLVKHVGWLAFCLSGMPNPALHTGIIVILFAPPPGGDITDGDAWEQVLLWDSLSSNINRWGRATELGRIIDFPEGGGFTDLAVGEIDGFNGPDIIVTSNVPEPTCGTGENTVELWLNPGAAVRDGSSQNITTNAEPILTMPPTFWYSIWVDVDAPVVRACNVMDVDGDGDLDILAAYSNSITRNVRWYRNPLNEMGADALIQGTFVNENWALRAANWEERPIGTVDGDIGAIVLGDMDNDGFDDVFVRASDVGVAMWFRRPTMDTTINPIFPPENPVTGTDDNTPVPDRLNFPWQVHVIDDYAPYMPVGLAIGDLTNDGFNDAAIAVGGALYWYDSTLANSVFDEWARDFLLDDTKENGTTDDPNDLDFLADGTLMNNLLIVDIDGDGVNDIIATLDRRVNSGVSDDAIIWFRNTLFDNVEGTDD